MYVEIKTNRETKIHYEPAANKIETVKRELRKNSFTKTTGCIIRLGIKKRDSCLPVCKPLRLDGEVKEMNVWIFRKSCCSKSLTEFIT